jgi:hypothetical protein
MGIHFGYYFFLNGLCLALVDIHLGDKSTLKDPELLIIGFSFSFDLFLTGIYLGLQPCHHLFHPHSVVI